MIRACNGFYLCCRNWTMLHGLPFILKRFIYVWSVFERKRTIFSCRKSEHVKTATEGRKVAGLAKRGLHEKEE